jgi:hypothetical protein
VSCDLYVTQIFHYIIKKKKTPWKEVSTAVALAVGLCGRKSMAGRGLNGQRPWVSKRRVFFFFFFLNLKWIIVFTCDREGIMENFSHASCT